MLYVYRYRNKLTGTYGPNLEFRHDEPKDYFRLIHDRCVLFPDKAKEELIHITVFEAVGTYDQQKGVLTFFNEDQSPAEDLDGGQAFEQLEALKQQLGGSNA